MIVATAGHVDHGKTALLKALTGVDLDTLPEERARGITIALGFAPLALPSGTASFVDVPGHERLVRTMVAGAHGVQAALLCVAADDGVMPQTREHLDVLGLLGVSRGVVAITRADRADADLVDLVRAEVDDLLVGSALAGAPVVVTSALEGRGMDALREALDALVADVRPEPDDGSFRMAVDRSFTLAGHGTVVTGSARGGAVSVGDDVRLWPGGRQVRVRGLEVHGAAVHTAGGGRLALNLAGVRPEEVARGTVVAAAAMPCPHVIDLAYRHVAELPLEDGIAVSVLGGTAEVLGRLAPIDPPPPWDPGQEGVVQVRLEAPLPCRVGDRLVVRRPSPPLTLGGGPVIDPWATRCRPRDRDARAAALARLRRGDPGPWLEAAGEAGLDPETWEARGGTGGIALGDRVVAPRLAERLEEALLAAVDAHRAAHPLAPGVQRATAFGTRLHHLDGRAAEALVARLVTAGRLEVEGPLLRRAGDVVRLDAAQRQALDAVEEALGAAGLVGCDDDALAAIGPDAAALVRVAARADRAVQVPDLGWVAAARVAALRTSLRAWFEAHDEPLTPAAFRDRFELTRRTTLPWLAWMDARGWTLRGEDGRVAGPALPDDG